VSAKFLPSAVTCTVTSFLAWARTVPNLHSMMRESSPLNAHSACTGHQRPATCVDTGTGEGTVPEVHASADHSIVH
jgi:hypothetical protein